MKRKIVYITTTAVIGMAAFFIGQSTSAIPQDYIELEKCIPLEDIAYCYTSKSDYPCFELKDVGNQLDNPGNRSYADIMQEINNRFLCQIKRSK